MHGIEIFREYLDEQIVQEIAESKAEREFYSFQTVCEAIKYSFPQRGEAILARLVEMLAFDALVGNNDRHPANWGVIVPVSRRQSPRFSPIYDTARALFWNIEETKIVKILQSDDMMNSYVERSKPQIAWDRMTDLNHFELVRLICSNYSEYRTHLEKFAKPELVRPASEMIESDFARLMTPHRRTAIQRCLRLRMERYCSAVQAQS